MAIIASGYVGVFIRVLLLKPALLYYEYETILMMLDRQIILLIKVLRVSDKDWSKKSFVTEDVCHSVTFRYRDVIFVSNICFFLRGGGVK